MRDASWTADLTIWGYRVHSLDAEPTASDWAALADEAPPAPVRALAESWAQPTMEPWRALVESAAIVNPGIRAAGADGVGLAPVRAIIERAERAAVVYDAEGRWHAPNRWGYAFSIRAPSEIGRSELLVLQPPATVADIQWVAHVLAVELPPSYRRFLMLTNGLQLGANPHIGVSGAGPQRADWNAVMLNLWMQISEQNEVTARWREFQGTYEYERIMDRERGENTFGSDETALIPFAYTNDDWCFDRTRPDSVGEFPIVFWDHELREATERYPDFDSWFAGEIDDYFFPRP